VAEKVSVQGDKRAVPQPLLAVRCGSRTRGPILRQDPPHLSISALAWRANWKSLTASSSGKSESKAMNTSGRSISLVILNLKLTCDFRLNCIGGGAANGCRDLTAVYGLLTEAYVKLCLCSSPNVVLYS
jgi:hypothetical protein